MLSFRTPIRNLTLVNVQLFVTLNLFQGLTSEEGVSWTLSIFIVKWWNSTLVRCCGETRHFSRNQRFRKKQSNKFSMTQKVWRGLWVVNLQQIPLAQNWERAGWGFTPIIKIIVILNLFQHDNMVKTLSTNLFLCWHAQQCINHFH